MLTERLDVPFNGPQLMAFAVSREPFEAFVTAYNRALVEADNRGLVELWEANVGRYVAERARIRWRVPHPTFERIVRTVRDAKHVLEAPRSVRDALTSSLARAASHLASDGEIRPAAWFVLEDAYIALFGQAPRRIKTFRDNALANLIKALDALPACVPEPPPTGPRGALLLIRELRFRSEAGHEVAPEEVNACRDTCSGPRINAVHDTTLPAVPPDSIHVIAAIEHANASIAFDVVLEALVGPYVVSRGPGPFLGCPAASRAFGPSVEGRAPLFRVPYLTDFSKGARWIAPASLEEAHREVSRMRAPDARWWRDDEELSSWVDAMLERVAKFAEDDRPSLDRWQTWAELTATWTLARDRFASLLESAAANDEAVVLVPRTSHCNMDGANGPRTAVWGEPIAVPR